MEKHAVILAAGKGTRMNTDVPKCAFEILGKPMAQYIIDDCRNCGIDDIVVVVGYKKEKMVKCLSGNVAFANQECQIGTGDAVKCAKKHLRNLSGITLIFPGDMPFVGTKVINQLIKTHLENKNDLTVVTTIYDDPKMYGRIYRENNLIKKIIEYKDATDEQRKIKEINSGLYCVNTELLFSALDQLHNNNNQCEYYLTDIVEILGESYRVDSFFVEDDYHLIGINDMKTLEEAEVLYKLKNAS